MGNLPLDFAFRIALTDGYRRTIAKSDKVNTSPNRSRSDRSRSAFVTMSLVVPDCRGLSCRFQRP